MKSFFCEKWAIIVFVASGLLISCASQGAAVSKLQEPVSIEESAWQKHFPVSYLYYDQGRQLSEEEDWLESQGVLDSALFSLLIEKKDSAGLDSIRSEFLLELVVSLESVYPQISRLGEEDSSYSFWEDAPEDEYQPDPNELVVIRSFLDTLNTKQFSFPVELNERVLHEVHYLSKKVPSFMEGSLSRMTRFEDMIRAKIRERNMPEDLVYLSLVESGYKVSAYSKAKASGLWQFIPATGRRYGLKVDWWVDMRRNPELATDGALSYLSDLYKEFGDWLLAMAAYNCGEGRIRRAIAKQNSRNYWDLTLPRETMHYVPRILAATIIGHYPHQYGLTPQKMEMPEFDTASVMHCMPLETAAKAIGADPDSMKFLNMELKRWCTPPNLKKYILKLPKGSREKFLAEYEKMDKSRLTQWHRHKVKWGDNLGAIARKYGVSLKSIKSTNNLRGNRIHAGQHLVIPLPKGALPPDKSSPSIKKVSKTYHSPKTRSATGSFFTYVVRKGDNLFDIGRKFGISVGELQEWNGLKPRSRLHIGQNLKIYGGTDTKNETLGSKKKHNGSFKKYAVKPGDTFYGIAIAHGISTEELKELIGANTNRLVVGQTIKVPENADVVKNQIKASSRGIPENNTKKSLVFPKKVLSNSVILSSQSGMVDYKVLRGESLYSIAKKFSVPLDDLMSWNMLNRKSRIYAGQRLKVKISSNAHKGNESKEPKDFESYIVRSGDTLWDIARRFGLSVPQLNQWNQLEGKKLVPGMRIRVKKP